MRVSVCKIFTFAAAHYLPGYDGKCRNLHGHTWTLEVEVSGPINESSGFVMDFAYLKDLVKQKVIDVLDHTCLNESLEGQIEDIYGVVNPTCEHVLRWIWERLGEALFEAFPKGSVSLPKPELERIRLYETPGSFAELKSTGRTVEDHESGYHQP